MARETLDRLIKELLDDVQTLQRMVTDATIGAVTALSQRDTIKSRLIYSGDALINRKRFEIENKCLSTIATQQPLASDLRVLASILEIITELERMGDYAKGIARINLIIRDDPLNEILVDLLEMAKQTVSMLSQAVDAFVKRDADTARLIPQQDDLVDGLFIKIHSSLIKFMIEHPGKADLANHLQWAAHNLERMSDRVTNICERTIFIVSGEMHELEETEDEWASHQES